jgi:hypothetical protein
MRREGKTFENIFQEEKSDDEDADSIEIEIMLFRPLSAAEDKGDTINSNRKTNFIQKLRMSQMLDRNQLAMKVNISRSSFQQYSENYQTNESVPNDVNNNDGTPQLFTNLKISTEEDERKSGDFIIDVNVSRETFVEFCKEANNMESPNSFVHSAFTSSEKDYSPIPLNAFESEIYRFLHKYFNPRESDTVGCPDSLV